MNQKAGVKAGGVIFLLALLAMATAKPLTKAEKMITEEKEKEIPVFRSFEDYSVARSRTGFVGEVKDLIDDGIIPPPPPPPEAIAAIYPPLERYWTGEKWTMKQRFTAEEGIMEVQIGGGPASAGYVWYPERNGWMRPWDETTFIARSNKPEWDIYIPGGV